MGSVTKAPKSKNLIPVPKAVERAGKTFTQTYWVKAEDVGLEAAGYDPKQPGSSASVKAFRAVVDKLAGPGAGSLAESYTTSWTGSCQNEEGARVMGTVAALLGMDREKVAKLPFITHTAHGQDLLKQYDAAMADSNNPLRKALMATYAVTQAALKDEPDTIRLMRGSKKDGPALLAAAKALADKGVRYDEAALTMELNTLNCFTSKDSVANGFAGTAGVVYSIDVPKSAVLFSYKSTPGHSTSYGINGNDEKEYTVMCQGPTAVSVRNISGKVGQEIYNYFAARGLTGDATPKEAPPARPPPDPKVSFKISTKGAEQLAALKELAAQVGGEVSAQGGVVLPASKMDAFIEGFEKSPAYDPSVKPIDKVKAWLSGKAASAVAEAKSLADNASSLKAGLESPKVSWRADEPESKGVAATVRAAVEKAQAELEASGKADMGSPGAAAPPKAPGVEAKVTQKQAGDDEAAFATHASAMEHMESKGFGALAKSILGAEVGAGGKVKLAEPEKVQAHEAGVSAAEDAMMEAATSGLSKDEAIAAGIKAYELVAKDKLAGSAPAPAGLSKQQKDDLAKAAEHFSPSKGGGNKALMAEHFGAQSIADLSPQQKDAHYEALNAKQAAIEAAVAQGAGAGKLIEVGKKAYADYVAKSGAGKPGGEAKHQIPAWAKPSDEKLHTFSSTKGLLTQWAWSEGHGLPTADTSLDVHPQTKAAVDVGAAALASAYDANPDITLKEAHEVATKAMSFALGKGTAPAPEASQKAPQQKKADAMGYQPSDVEAAKAPGSSAVAGVPSKAYPGHTGPALEMKPSDTPQSWNVKHVGEAKGIGGAGEKHFYESSSGKKWLVKVAAAKGGGEEQPYKAEAQVFASKVAQLVKPGSVEVGHASHGGKAATIQPWLDVKGTLGGKPPESLSESQKADVASEHVLDWLTAQHDSHGKNLVIKPDGKVVGIDKEQAFKHIGKDKLDVDYHPNSAFGEEEPYYNKFWRSFAEGTMDFDPKAMKDAIDRVKQIPTSHYVEQLKPYAESLHPNDKAAQNKLLTAAVQRKENLQKDFEQFIGKHYEKREGAKGTFTFEGGWQKGGSKASAPKAEAGGPAPSPKAEAQAHEGGDVEKLPDVPEEDLKAFFAAKAGEQPPHRKWYWKKWAEAAMNKAKVPKEEQPEVWKKVLAQGKVMVAKKTLAGQKVSQAQHEAYIKAQAAKKGATPEMMPVVQEKPKAEKPAAAPAAPKPQKAPPEHPYQYYWKTWANAAAKEATGKGAPSHVHDKISGLAKKFVAEKQAAGAKFTGKDLEKFIKAAAKKGGDHPGEI